MPRNPSAIKKGTCYFFEKVACPLFLVLAWGWSAAAVADVSHTTDLLIVGGTESGWAAAIQAARMKVRSITLVSDGQWLGGQYTEQALCCVDENKGVGLVGWGVDWHPMKRSFHRSGLFKELMDRIEAFNSEKYGAPMPGRPYHGPSTFRPVEAEAIFRQMLQPYLDAGQVRWIKNCYPVAAVQTENGKQLTGLRFRALDGGDPEFQIDARLTIDASDWGDAIQVAGAAYFCGPDPHDRFGEPSAPADLSEFPANEMNPITWAMVLEEKDHEQAAGDQPIPRPANYDDRCYARTSQPSAAAMGDLKWDRPAPVSSIPHWPPAGRASPRQLSVYNVRRLVDGYKSKTGRTLILLNYMLGQDYPLERLPRRVVEALEATEPGASQKNIVQMTRPQRDIIFADAKQHSLGVLYHLQTFVHDRAGDKTHSFRHFALSDEFGTADRLPPKPYIREALRLQAMYMMREQDGRNQDGPDKQSAQESLANVMYHDGLFSWQFHYDFHRTGRAYLKDEGDAGPWIDYEKKNRHTRFVSDRSVFPLRSLIPLELDGLLGAQKNVGYSSIVSAAIRLHDQCVHIGQAAGATAAVALQHDVAPREIPYNFELLEQVRDGLCGETPGSTAMLLWPYRDLAADHPAFVAINRLAARLAFPDDRRAVDFQPNAAATADWRADVARRSLAGKQHDGKLLPPAEPMSRGEFALLWWRKIAELPDISPPRAQANDADADGILDTDDALPLDRDNDNLPDWMEM